MPVTENGWGKVVVLCSFYFQAFTFGSFLAMNIFYTSWLDEFHSGRGATSWAMSLSLATCYGSGPFVASLVSSFGHRPVVIAGSLLCSTGLVASCFATSIYTLIASIGMLGGLGLGLQSIPCITIIPLYFKNKCSLALGIALSGVGVGTFLNPPFFTWLEQQYTWKGSLMIISGFALNMVVCGALLRPVVRVRQARKENYDLSQVTFSASEDAHFLTESRSSAEVESQSKNDSVPTRSKQNRTGLKIIKDDLYSIEICHTLTGKSYDGFDSLSKQQNEIPIVLQAEGDKSDLDELGKLKTTNTEKGKEVPKLNLSYKLFPTEKSKKECKIVIEIEPVANNSSTLKDQTGSSSCVESARPNTCCCSNSFRTELMLYWKIMKNPHFVVFVISTVFTSTTIIMPAVYMVDRAIDNGVEKSLAALALSMYGAGNLFGRVALGFLADHVLDCLSLNAVCLILCGVSTCLSSLCGDSAVLHDMYGFTFGTFIGGYMTLAPLILVELMGLSLFNHTLGLMFAFRALGILAGTPATGWIYEASGNYTASFLIHGALLAFSGLVLVALKLAVIQSKRRIVSSGCADNDKKDDGVDDNNDGHKNRNDNDGGE